MHVTLILRGVGLKVIVQHIKSLKNQANKINKTLTLVGANVKVEASMSWKSQSILFQLLHVDIYILNISKMGFLTLLLHIFFLHVIYDIYCIIIPVIEF